METADIQKRVRRMIEESQRAAAERRTRAASAERDGTSVLTETVTPVMKTIAAALKAEGYPFRVLTPVGSVRLVSEASAEDFVELMLDTRRDPPALVGRVSHGWGRRVLVEEQVVREDAAIAGLTEDDALEFALGQLRRFVER